MENFGVSTCLVLNCLIMAKKAQNMLRRHNTTRWIVATSTCTSHRMHMVAKSSTLNTQLFLLPQTISCKQYTKNGNQRARI